MEKTALELVEAKKIAGLGMDLPDFFMGPRGVVRAGGAVGCMGKVASGQRSAARWDANAKEVSCLFFTVTSAKLRRAEARDRCQQKRAPSGSKSDEFYKGKQIPWLPLSARL